MHSVTPAASGPMLHENAITWELIAEASKAETIAVHTMVLKRFDELDTENKHARTLREVPEHARGGNKDDAETQEGASQLHTSYLSYPPQDIGVLLRTVKIHHMLKNYEGLEFSEELQVLMGMHDKKRDKKKTH